MGKSKDPTKRTTQTNETSKTLQYLRGIQEETPPIGLIALGKKRPSKKRPKKKKPN